MKNKLNFSIFLFHFIFFFPFGTLFVRLPYRDHHMYVLPSKPHNILEFEKSNNDNELVGGADMVRLQIEMGTKGVWGC